MNEKTRQLIERMLGSNPLVFPINGGAQLALEDSHSTTTLVVIPMDETWQTSQRLNPRLMKRTETMVNEQPNRATWETGLLEQAAALADESGVCTACDGKRVRNAECDECGGDGECRTCRTPGACLECGGSGQATEKCTACRGTGIGNNQIIPVGKDYGVDVRRAQAAAQLPGIHLYRTLYGNYYGEFEGGQIWITPWERRAPAW